VTEDLDSPLNPFLDLVRDEASTVHVVTLVGVTDPETHESTWQAERLELDEDLRRGFKATLRRTLSGYRALFIDRYEPGWVPVEGEMAQAGLEVLEDSPLLDHIRGATQRAAAPQPAPGEEAPAEAMGPIQAYAVVVARVHEGVAETAVFVRNRTPVQELRQGLTAFWHGRRLTKARRLLTFDAGVDVAILEDVVLIKNASGFERLFVPPQVRIAGARRAVDQLVAHIPVVNVGDLNDVVERDSIFGSKLRLLGKTGLLDDITADRLRHALNDTGLVDRFIFNDQLVFPTEQVWRWRFLEALEDSFVSSAGTGILYRSASKKRWQRRVVTGAVRSEGRVSQLCGPIWGPSTLEAIRQEIRRAQAVYFLETPEGAHNLTVEDLTPLTDGQPSLEQLRDLPDCG
jgi:hypothetical protein